MAGEPSLRNSASWTRDFGRRVACDCTYSKEDGAFAGRSDKGGATVYQKHRFPLGRKALYGSRRLLTAST